jgi:hypothetical protein
MKIKIVILAALCFLTAAPANAGWIFVSGSKMGNQTTYIQNNKIRMDTGPNSMIFDVDKNLVTAITPSDKSYWQGAPGEMAKETQQAMDQAMKMMEETLAMMPPEQRESMRKMMAGSMPKPPAKTKAPADIQIKATGKTSKIAGYAVKKYDVYENGKLQSEIWISPDIHVDKDLDIAKFSSMMDDFSSMGGAQAGAWGGEMADLIRKGWGLKYTMHMDGRPPVNITTSSVEKKKLKASVFAIPKGYRKVSMQQAFGMPGQ